jgi:hypothetical protein
MIDKYSARIQDPEEDWIGLDSRCDRDLADGLTGQNGPLDAKNLTDCDSIDDLSNPRW